MLLYLLEVIGMNLEELKGYWKLTKDDDKYNFVDDMNSKIAKIIQGFNKFYKQENIEFRINFDMDALNFVIKTNKKFLNLSERSNGLRWYLNMYIQLLAKTKRNDEALRKLDRTHDNMQRVNDIILELENNLEPLKKQSINAKKYLENKKMLDEIEVSLIVSEVDSINAEYQLNKKKVSSLNEEIMKLESESSLDNSKVEELKLKETKLSEELYKLQGLLAEVSAETQSLLGKKDLIIERQKYNASDTKVHEVLKYTKNKPENIITVNDILLNHYPDKNKSRANYLPLLELAYQENKDDRTLHYLGREYMYYNENDKAIKMLKKHINSKT